MPNFLIAYHGGQPPKTQEEGAASMKKWQAWIEGLGENIVNSGTPLMDTRIVTANDVQDEGCPDAMKGFAIVKAEDIEAALEISKSDPFLDMQGTIRVSQMMEMPT